MDADLLTEINYLTRLIEQHRKKLPVDLNPVQKILPKRTLNSAKLETSSNLIPKAHPLTKVFSEQACDAAKIKSTVTSVKVHVNPNFKPQNPVIHINPKVRIKPLVHVNPKMMKDAYNSEESKKLQLASVSESNMEQLVPKPNLKRSVYVNPKLMSKISSENKDKPVEKRQKISEIRTIPVCTRLKLVRGTNSPRTPVKKQQNSSVIILSKRKLVRVRRSSKGSIMSPPDLSKLKKTVNSPFKKTKISPLKIVKNFKVVNGLEQSVSRSTNLVMVKNVRPTINRYRIDRTMTQTMKSKPGNDTAPKRAMNKKMELITIGGIVYKSSKNQLVRRSYGTKRKRITSSKTEKFIIATNGKKLCRLKSGKETERTIGLSMAKINTTKLAIAALQKSNHKTLISNKVKQRSIQILRNKMRKNNQPCLIYQKFGYCANHKKGMCPKLHDKKQVSLCKKFLQGNCLLDNCPLSHDVGPEKMPTCKYFLEGCCVRDSCPYRHVKDSSNTRICIEFLQGYCAKGLECTRRHEYLCPEFANAGHCSKGKYCAYPHKIHSSTIKHNNKHLKRKQEAKSATVAPSTAEALSPTVENRLRYYEQGDSFVRNIDEKRDSVMRKLKIMKRVNAALNDEPTDLIESSTSDSKANAQDARGTEIDTVKGKEAETECLRRPPIGVLPAYIPIN